MKRRYDLTRSDNFPATGIHAEALSAAAGTFTITTGFPVVSATISGTDVLAAGGPNLMAMADETSFFEDSSLLLHFAPSEAAFVSQVELLFEGGDYARTYSIDGRIGGTAFNLAAGSDPGTQHIIQSGGYVLRQGDFLQVSAEATGITPSSSSEDEPGSSSSSLDSGPRAVGRIYYLPLAMLSAAFAGTMSSIVSATSGTGFTIAYENAPVPCVLSLSYLAT